MKTYTWTPMFSGTGASMLETTGAPSSRFYGVV